MTGALARLRGASAAVLLAAARLLPAQEPAPSPEPVRWHEVKQGETLEELSRRYLGDPKRWAEIWRLNPEVKDAHKLRPGQRIRIGGAPRSAAITALARKVEAKPYPEPWTAARLGTTLKERDGLRTYERSSAGLAFDDGSRLLVSEMSLVFLRESGPRLTGVVTRRSLEVVEGQAELAARQARDDDSAYEIVIGGSSTRPRANREGAQARARRTVAGTAQLMIYRGEADVESGSATVSVSTGMGTVVPEGQPPRQPEKLLEAPSLLAPLPGTAYEYANPRFSWTAVPGAATYTVEVCSDAECGELVERDASVVEVRWRPEGLPLGKLFFRVTAVSGSGLDGYPSNAASFTVESLWRRPPSDREPLQ